MTHKRYVITLQYKMKLVNISYAILITNYYILNHISYQLHIDHRHLPLYYFILTVFPNDWFNYLHSTLNHPHLFA